MEIEGWDIDYIDMLGPGHIQFDRDGGHIGFGCVQIGLDCWYSPTGAPFNFQGHDEMTEVSGDGDADLEPDGTLTGEIRFHHGDEMPFTAKRWSFFRSLLDRASIAAGTGRARHVRGWQLWRRGHFCGLKGYRE